MPIPSDGGAYICTSCRHEQWMERRPRWIARLVSLTWEPAGLWVFGVGLLAANPPAGFLDHKDVDWNLPAVVGFLIQFSGMIWLAARWPLFKALSTDRVFPWQRTCESCGGKTFVLKSSPEGAKLTNGE